MNNIRLGYACINTCCDSPSRTCRASTLEQKGIDHAVSLARTNLNTVLSILRWNEQHGIKVYRLSSDMFPHITNPVFLRDDLDQAYPLHHFDAELSKIGAYARKHGHRLSFHPGQFNQIGAPDELVFAKTIRELSTHAEILDRMGCGPESVMVIHGGGVYGNKARTMERWSRQFQYLPLSARSRLVVENCERGYNYRDVLRLSSETGSPVVFDTHHHECYSVLIEHLPKPETFIPLILDTWSARDVRPKFHVSEQAEGKRVGAHSDYVTTIPKFLMELEIDVMIEAKMKDQALLKLRDNISRPNSTGYTDSLLVDRYRPASVLQTRPTSSD